MLELVMKCEVFQELLEEYIDGEIAPADRKQVEAHLIACADCSARLAALTAEQELFARYDREVEVPPFLWTRVAAHTISESPRKNSWRALPAIFAIPSKTLAGAIATLLIAVVIGLVYFLSRPSAPKPTIATTLDQPAHKQPEDKPQPIPETGADHPRHEVIAFRRKPAARVTPKTDEAVFDHSDVLSSDLAGLDIDEQDTARHIEQSENLLRSIRNVVVSDADEEIDVTYDKALSRRLLNENVVLRRDAEMKAKFPTKTLLADLEPFLIDIANLPDRARPEDVRVIKERVQKTEIVAALLVYQDLGSNNR
jgi:putative zinc finger protein